MRLSITLFFSVSLFVACEKEALAPELATADLAVVQAYLLEGNEPMIRISRQAALGESSTEELGITDLSPLLSIEGTTYALTSRGEGWYAAAEELTVAGGKTYGLTFAYGDVEVSATTTVPEKPTGYTRSAGTLDLADFPFSSVDPIILRWDNPTSDFFQVNLEYAEQDTVVLGQFGNRPTGGGGPGMLSEPQQTDSYEVRFRSVSYLGTYRAILYRVNPEYAVFSGDANGESRELVAPYTNVTNGLGLFTGVAADTLTFEVRE